jgi:hypothetical protein
MDTQVSVPTQEPVSKVELASPQPPVSPEQGQAVAPVVFTPEQQKALDAIVQKAVSTATTEAVKVAKDTGRRDLQSQQDRNKAALSKLQRENESTRASLQVARQRLQVTDPEAFREVENTELRIREQQRAQEEQQEQMSAQQKEFHEQFRSRQEKFITGLGLDPKDPDIDWADDAYPNYLEAMSRTLDSVGKKQVAKTQATTSSMEKRLKELEAKVAGANIEANSVTASASSGAPTSADSDFLKKFASGDLPLSKENLKRYDAIQSSRS